MQVTDRSPEAEAHRKAAAAKKEPATAAQLKYLTSLAASAGTERFDAEFVRAVKVTDIKPRAPRERTATASKRLTKAAARKLISTLADHRTSRYRVPTGPFGDSQHRAGVHRPGRRRPGPIEADQTREAVWDSEGSHGAGVTAPARSA